MSKVVKINSKKSIVSLDKEDLSSYDLIKWIRTSSLGVGHRCFIDEQPFEKVAAEIYKEKHPSDQVKVAEAVVKNHDGTVDVFLKVTEAYTQGMYKKDPTKTVFAGSEEAVIIKEINSDVSKTAFEKVTENDYFRLEKEAYDNQPTGGGTYTDPNGKTYTSKEIPAHLSNDDNSGQKDPNEIAAAPADPNQQNQVTASIDDGIDEHSSEEELEKDIEEDKAEGGEEEDLKADENALKELESEEVDDNSDEEEFKEELQKFLDEKGIDGLIKSIPEEELEEMKAILGLSCGEEQAPLKTMNLGEMSDMKPIMIEFEEGKDPFAELFGKHLKKDVDEHGLDMVAAVVSVMIKK